MGNIQLLDEAHGLHMEAHHSFSQEFVDFFATPRQGASCTASLARRERMIVPDLLESDFFRGTEGLAMLLKEGVRAVQSTPLISRDGTLIGVLSTHYRQPRIFTERDLRLIDLLARQAADLIEKLRAEESARMNQRIYRAIGDSIKYGIWICGPDGSNSYASESFLKLVGTTQEQCAGFGWTSALHPDDAQRTIDSWKECVRTEGTWDAEHRFLGVDGRYHWVLARGVPVRDDRGAILGWAGINLDIDQVKAVEERLRRSNQELLRANEDLNQFAFAASHDLQEPLRMITSYSQLLLRGYRGNLDAEASVCVDFITEGTSRMRELLADLLAYTQLTAQEDEVLEPVDLNLVLQQARENCQATIEETGAILTSDPLPCIRGYQPHFLQLLQNLVANALKYRSALPPRIHISAQQQNGNWRFGVADNGIGIDPRYHHKIFGVFKRLHDKSIPGTGIGLAICQRVIDRYGGRIWVESELGSGATFCFTLPASEKEGGTGNHRPGGH
jgi:PAS domain S-box-containing protein